MAFVTWKMRKLVQIYPRAVKWYEASIHAYVAFRLSSSSPAPLPPPPQKKIPCCHEAGQQWITEEVETW